MPLFGDLGNSARHDGANVRQSSPSMFSQLPRRLGRRACKIGFPFLICLGLVSIAVYTTLRVPTLAVAISDCLAVCLCLSYRCVVCAPPPASSLCVNVCAPPMSRLLPRARLRREQTADSRQQGQKLGTGEREGTHCCLMGCLSS